MVHHNKHVIKIEECLTGEEIWWNGAREGIGKCAKKNNSGNTLQLRSYFSKGTVGKDFNQVEDAGLKPVCRKTKSPGCFFGVEH